MVLKPAVKRALLRSLEVVHLKQWLRPHVIRLLASIEKDHLVIRNLDLFRDLKRLAVPPRSNQGGKRVLIMSFRGRWLPHSTWEGLVAEGIRRRGGLPTLFICSGGLPRALPGKSFACGIASIHARPFYSCRACTQCGLSIAESLELPLVRMDDLVSGIEADRLMGVVDGLDIDSLRNFRHRDLPVGKLVQNTARWFLCVSDLEAAPEGDAVFLSFVKSGLVVAEAAHRLLDRVQPDALFLLNGLFFAERIVAEEARRRGIRVHTYEHGFMTDSICFSEDIASYFDISRLWQEVKDVPLSESQERALENYLADRRRGLRAPINYWPTITEDEHEVSRSLGLDPSLPTAALFTNVTWDSAVQDRDRAFPSMRSWLRESIQLFAARPDAQLVIRIHPAEVRLHGRETRDAVLDQLRSMCASLPRNVHVVSPEEDLSSYTLMGLARCGLVYTSTTGLEMAMEGMPVVVAGEVHYSEKGFTLDPATADEYRKAVDSALAGPRSLEVRKKARRYGYALFFQYGHPFHLVSENPPDFVPTLTTTDPKALDPGGDPTMDQICQALLHGGSNYRPE